MKTASVAKIAAEFADFLETSRRQPVLITRNGKPIAVLLAVHDRADAEQLADRSRSLRSIFQEAHEQLEKGAGIPHEQFWQEVARNRRGKRSRRAKRISHKAR